MVEVFRLVREVLADDGTLWLNLGDSYAAGGMSNASSKSTLGGGKDCGASNYSITRGVLPGLKPKDLCGMPWKVAFALQADGWHLRSDIIWHKPNPMPESVTDRPTKSHEYLFLLTKNPRYFYDAEAVREPATNRACGNVDTNVFAVVDPEKGRTRANLHKIPARETRNRRSVWTIATQSFSEAHFATFPRKLVEPCILAGSRPGDIVLDPFLGSGTVAQVAQDFGRDWIGIDLNATYTPMQERRTAQTALALAL